MKHLLVDISGHGFGHLAQTAPVLNFLAKHSELKLTIRSYLPEAILKSRIIPDFAYLPSTLDFGLEMFDAVRVDASRSYARYQRIHTNYDELIDQEAEALSGLAPDLLVSNIPYHSLTAAALIGLPSVAMCSLNWAELFSEFCSRFPAAQKIHLQMQEAYQLANCFIQPQPSIPMPSLRNIKAIQPIAQRGKAQRNELLHQLDVAPDTQIILVGIGGMQMDIQTKLWPQRAQTIWLVPEAIDSTRPDMISIADLKLPYLDLMASANLIITKTGYGMIVEAVTHQIPVLCLQRGNWSEEVGLHDWAQQYGYLKAVSQRTFFAGDFSSQVDELLTVEWVKPPVSAQGHRQAAEIIVQTMG